MCQTRCTMNGKLCREASHSVRIAQNQNRNLNANGQHTKRNRLRFVVNSAIQQLSRPIFRRRLISDVFPCRSKTCTEQAHATRSAAFVRQPQRHNRHGEYLSFGCGGHQTVHLESAGDLHSCFRNHHERRSASASEGRRVAGVLARRMPRAGVGAVGAPRSPESPSRGRRRRALRIYKRGGRIPRPRLLGARVRDARVEEGAPRRGRPDPRAKATAPRDTPARPHNNQTSNGRQRGP